MTITINTDASYHPVHKAGAYAFWIVCAQGRVIHSGPLKSVLNSQDAELQAIGNALAYVLKSPFTDIQHIYINTDCKYGIEAVTKGKHMCGCLETVKKVQAIINKLHHKYQDSRDKKKFRKFVSWRHVPAHTDGTTRRTWVNNRMDSMAKTAMWQSVNDKKHKQ